jgi:hypothetical protein
MTKEKPRKRISPFRSWLPAFVNGTLDPIRRRAIEIRLRYDQPFRNEIARLRQIQADIKMQESKIVPAGVLLRIQQQIQNQAAPPLETVNTDFGLRTIGRPFLVSLILLILFALAATLYAMPPGIMLEWSVEGEAPSSFRIYRAVTGGANLASVSDYTLLSEIPAEIDGESYVFTDIRPLPGQTYLYRVDAVGDNGLLAISQSVVGRGFDALPGQLASISAILGLAIMLWIAIRQWRHTASGASYSSLRAL